MNVTITVTAAGNAIAVIAVVWQLCLLLLPTTAFVASAWTTTTATTTSPLLMLYPSTTAQYLSSLHNDDHDANAARLRRQQRRRRANDPFQLEEGCRRHVLTVTAAAHTFSLLDHDTTDDDDDDGFSSSSRQSSSSSSQQQQQTQVPQPAAQLQLVVLIPAYNEAKRLPSTLNKYRKDLLDLYNNSSNNNNHNTTTDRSSIHSFVGGGDDDDDDDKNDDNSIVDDPNLRYRQRTATTVSLPLPPRILVVDDGSTDGTYQAVMELQQMAMQQPQPRQSPSTSDNDTKSSSSSIAIDCLLLPHNLGKGGALQCGVEFLCRQQQQQAQEKQEEDRTVLIILTQDADGSGELQYLPAMMDRLQTLLLIQQQQQHQDECDASSSQQLFAAPAMVMGNRNYNVFSPRGITRWGFQTVVRILMMSSTGSGNSNGHGLRVQDSQCGYKLMTLSAAKILYQDLHLTGWSHDVEVLYRATLLNIPIAELPIEWVDVPEGSKVLAQGVAKVSLQMLWDVIRLRWNYSITKAWRLPPEEDESRPQRS